MGLLDDILHRILPDNTGQREAWRKREETGLMHGLDSDKPNLGGAAPEKPVTYSVPSPIQVPAEDPPTAVSDGEVVKVTEADRFDMSLLGPAAGRNGVLPAAAVSALGDLTASKTTEQPANSVPAPMTSALPSVKDRLATAIEERNKLSKMVPADLDTRKDDWKKNVGKSILMSLPQLGSLLMNPNLTDKQSLMLAAGNMIGAGLRGVIDPYGDERQTLEMKKERADADVQAAQQMYNQDLEGRTAETKIKDIEDDNAAKVVALGQKEREIDLKAFEAATKRANTFINLVKTGRIDVKDNPDFIEALSDSVGAKVVLSDFDPLKDKVTDVKIVADAQNNKAYVVTTSVGGVVKEQVVKDETGKPAYIKDPRVKAEEIRAATNIETTTIRTKSAEAIAADQIRSREELAKLGFAQDEIDGIQKDFYTEFERTPDDVILKQYAAINNMLVEPEKDSPKQVMSPELKARVLQEYWDNRRNAIANQRMLSRPPKKPAYVINAPK